MIPYYGPITKLSSDLRSCLIRDTIGAVTVCGPWKYIAKGSKHACV